jgi:hypothetical protein
LGVLVEFDQLFSASPSLSGLEKHLKRLANCTSTEDILNQTTNTSTTNSNQIQHLLPPHQGKPTNLEEFTGLVDILLVMRFHLKWNEIEYLCYKV